MSRNDRAMLWLIWIVGMGILTFQIITMAALRNNGVI